MNIRFILLISISNKLKPLQSKPNHLIFNTIYLILTLYITENSQQYTNYSDSENFMIPKPMKIWDINVN